MKSSKTKLEKSIAYFVKNPLKLFLFDGIGALVSAFLLGIVLVKYESIFGIPSSILFILASVPITFVIYDFLLYFLNPSKKSQFLFGIAFANLGYCILSLGLTFTHFDEITYMGWTYILLEMSVLFVLIVIEYSVAKKLKESN